MKKIFIILLCMITLNVNATEMCARDDTVVIPLDMTIGRDYNKSKYNATEWIWWNSYSYGTIYGDAACLSKKEIMMYSNWDGKNSAPDILNTATDELVGLSGYYMNADVNDKIPDAEKPDYERKYCYGRMTHPLSSPWFYGGLFNIPTANDCLRLCVSYAQGSPQGRGSVFLYAFLNSIGTVPPWPMD